MKGRIKGEQLYVFIASAGAFLPMGASTDCSLRLTAALVEVNSKGQGLWRRYRVSQKGWEINCSGFYLEQMAVPNSMLEGVKLHGMTCRVAISILAKELVDAGVNIESVTPDRTATLVGDAIITDCEYSGSRGSISTYSVSLQGTGSLEQIA